MFRVGDYVVRKSYGKDILFRINYIYPYNVAKLKGISYRVLADAPLRDLELAGGMRFTDKESSAMGKVEESMEAIIKNRQILIKTQKPVLQKTAKVLHIDGDVFYLNLCLRYYETLGIKAVGEHVTESEQPRKIKTLLENHNPDVLVITGHDSLNKNYKDLRDLREYKNSGHFIEAVKNAREVKPTTEQLVIFSGACQSAFEELLEAGADYAASPQRVLIHALDPVFIVDKIVHCPFHEVLPIESALEHTITKFKGLGGYEVIGKARKGGPVTEAMEEKEYVRDQAEAFEDIKDDEEALELEIRRQQLEDEYRNYMGNTMPSRR